MVRDILSSVLMLAPSSAYRARPDFAIANTCQRKISRDSVRYQMPAEQSHKHRQVEPQSTYMCGPVAGASRDVSCVDATSIVQAF